MKKNISLLVFIGILLAFNFIIAKDMPSNSPFGNIENRMADIEKDIEEIWEAIEELRGPVCEPSVEICDGIDNDCDGEVDEVCGPVVEDDFNSYSLGNAVGQGGWLSYSNGDNFIIQRNITKEGARALFVDASADSVIVKQGFSRASGSQSIYLNADRTHWGGGSFFQIRLTKGPWATGDPNLSFLAVTFEQDGRVGYSPGLSEPYVYFGTFSYEWSRLDIEWRASDKKARYRINTGPWTAWDDFPNSSYFTDFDYIGFDFSKSSGSGGVYIDFLY
jgi:hypothetical protein